MSVSLNPTRLNVAFHLTLSDIYKATAAIMRSARAKLLIVGSVVTIISLLAGGFALARVVMGLPPPPGIDSLPAVWGIIFPPLFMFLVCYVSPYFGARSLYKNNANFKGEIRYSFSDDGVTIEVTTARSELQWSSFVQVRETRDFFLLFVRKTMAHIVVKRAFASQEEIAEFRDLVRRHVKKTLLRSG
jgi:hypothetical protein